MANPILQTKVYNYEGYKILIKVHGKRSFKIKNNKGKLIKKDKEEFTHTHKALQHAQDCVDQII